jgi:hypothetical protein
MTRDDVLVIGMVDECPIYHCPRNGQTHEHPRQLVVDADHRAALRELTRTIIFRDGQP